MKEQEKYDIIELLRAMHQRYVGDWPVHFRSTECWILCGYQDIKQPFDPPLYSVIVAVRLTRGRFRIHHNVIARLSGSNLNKYDMGPKRIEVMEPMGVIGRPSACFQTFLQNMAAIPEVNKVMADPTLIKK